MIIYQGPSRIMPKHEIVAIATGLNRPSENRKTGPMAHIWILLVDVSPLEAIRLQLDAAICGGCPQRHATGGNCYVNVGQAPEAIWQAFRKGRYPTAWTPDTFAGRKVRLGAYGDPAAIPLSVWDRVLERADGWTGYTHQWRNRKLADVLKYCQASTERLADVSRNPSSYRILPTIDSPLAPGEKLCPSLWGTTCAECLACNGTAKIAIPDHGPRRQRNA